MKKLRNWLIGLAVVSTIAYLSWVPFAIWLAPDVAPQASTDPAILSTQARFLEALHAGRYDTIPEHITALRSAYLKNPRDPKTLLYFAHAHFWKGSERSRLDDISEVVPDDLFLADRLFLEAYRLNPEDKRILSWRAASKAELGILIDDQRLLREGYFGLKDAVRQYPQFGHFTSGYAFSNLPPRSPVLKEGIDHAWRALEVCKGAPFDRKNPTMEGYFATETHTGPRRVCFSGAIAPHGLEGVILSLGDLLVKGGHKETGKAVYQMIKTVPTYSTWPFKWLLEKRIEEADKRAEIYRVEKNPKLHPEVLGNSKYVCVICHMK